ncbi:MAG: lysine biosynthesis protein LysW [Candidatus Pacebacteria bacterium CG10_big_fil_rev_8_21_14_0_10_56_10]|nr:MAG: lysine biosynthesis protein LysW [Candidatus Pacebacteria bacterium CG10_big_fil_rev_8_21_14_0_10_56_10]
MPTVCPTCDAQVVLPAGTELSEIISCPECQTQLAVKAVGDEPQVEPAPAIEEDWGE